jgi:plastocyanin
MRGLLASIALALPLVCGCGSGAPSATTSGPSTHTVVMDGTGFEPANLKIKTGDTVEWVNKDPFPHTATSKERGFDSKEIDAGKSWKHTFSAKGEFPYACTLHPTMKATLSVE